jgi:ribosomal protein L16 Arg81 hydroxylase
VNRLSNDLGHPFQTNIYITPPNSQGFPAHYDTHDVFVLQVEGSKTWRIYEHSPVVLPTKQMEFQKEKHPAPQFYTELELTKGDLLYIPRGMMHDAQTNSDLSVHVTLGWLGYTWTDVMVQMLLEYSKNNEAPRRFIDPFKNKETNDLEKEFKSVIQQFASTITLQNSIDQFRLELAANQRFFFNDLLNNAKKFTEISSSSMFLLRKNVSFVIENGPDEVRLKIGSRAITFPQFTSNTLSFILNMHQVFSINNLPDDLDEEGKMVLLKRLVKEGVITLV